MKRIVAVEPWLESVNRTYADLVENGLDPNLRRIKLYPGTEDFYLEPEPGVSFEFDSDSKMLKAVAITIIRRVDLAPEFKDFLSEPYGCLDKSAVRTAWGSPLRTSEPLVMPEPIGKTGGWDMYRLSGAGFGYIDLIYSYTKDFVVSGLVLRGAEDEA